MKDLLFFHPRNDYTGSTRVLANVIESEYSGQMVDVITNRNHDKGFLSELSNVHIINSGTLMPFGKKIPLFTSFAWRIQSFLFALLYGWCYKTFYINTIVPFYVALVGRFYGKKIVYHIHEKFIRKTLSVRIMEWVFAHTEAHRIFVSEYTKKCYPVNPLCTSEVCYNHLGKQFLCQVRIKPIEDRKRNTILMIASLSKIKGLSTFMAVAKLLPNFHFRLILSTDMRSIQAFFGESVPENIELIPAQSDIHPYLREADLILNLSNPFYWVETFGMTILEAMAYGVPAIVPNVGGPTELIVDGYNGYCVDVTDAKLVASKMKIMLERDNYERLANHALIRFEQFR